MTKKIVLAGLILIILGYIALQNGPTLFLSLLAVVSHSPAGQTANPGSGASPLPPFKDGTYTGTVADAFYGTIQVQAMVSNGKLTDVKFLQYPSDRSRSIAINTIAMPRLTQEAIQAQSGNVNVISGATDSSHAFVQSLSSALAQAK